MPKMRRPMPGEGLPVGLPVQFTGQTISSHGAGGTENAENCVLGSRHLRGFRANAMRCVELAFGGIENAKRPTAVVAFHGKGQIVPARTVAVPDLEQRCGCGLWGGAVTAISAGRHNYPFSWTILGDAAFCSWNRQKLTHPLFLQVKHRRFMDPN